jgi:hypothetical protein
MTTTVQAGPGTATNLLFGPGANAAEALARQILAAPTGLDRALERLPQATRQAAVREAAAAAAGLLDVDLDGLLLAGWRAHRDLTGAARRTLAVPRRWPSRGRTTDREQPPRPARGDAGQSRARAAARQPGRHRGLARTGVRRPGSGPRCTSRPTRCAWRG